MLGLFGFRSLCNLSLELALGGGSIIGSRLGFCSCCISWFILFNQAKNLLLLLLLLLLAWILVCLWISFFLRGGHILLLNREFLLPFLILHIFEGWSHSLWHSDIFLVLWEMRITLLIPSCHYSITLARSSHSRCTLLLLFFLELFS